MKIKTTRDGREVTVKDGNLYVADKCFGHNIELAPEQIKSKYAEQMPDAHYMCRTLLLTKEEGDRAIEATTGYWEEKAAAEKKARLELEATLPKFRMLIRSGHYLMNEAIDTVCLEPDASQEKYADWLKNKAVMRSIQSRTRKIKIKDSPTARAITAADSSPYRYGSSESIMWEITAEQETAIVSECAAAQARRDEKKARSKAERDAIFAKAAQTGTRQVLDSWVTEECTENLDDCSFDMATEWALPEGSKEITYNHCH